MTVFIGLVVRSFAPFTHNAVSRNSLVNLSALAKTVREYLIHNAAFEEIRRLVCAFIDSQLEQIAEVNIAFVDILFLDIMASSVCGI